MPRVKIGPAQPDRKTIDVEIARLRDLDIGALRARWHTVFGRRPSPHLPRHLLFRDRSWPCYLVLATRCDAIPVLSEFVGDPPRDRALGR